MQEVTTHYEAGLGIRPPRKSGKVRGCAREVVPGGGVELIADQRAGAVACARAWLDDQIAQGRLYPMPVEDEPA
jgi:hypothetical protein